ncbi:MAG TPA: universal stress protein [Terriglobales bacterium]|nr:universal stress protein [Terriglobales bacterium]
MYDNILLTLGASAADRPIIEHVKRLASVMHSRVCLLHVASGAPAQLYGADAGGKEVNDGRVYLDRVKREFEAAGIATVAELGYGDPAKEIQKWVEQKGCDLVAMGTHGHKLLADLVLGTTANRVQHNISVPVLLLRAK